jgi:hypothetical protein
MALTSANVRVAITGSISKGPTSATLPTSTSATLTGFTDLGYIGEDGVTEARDQSSEKIKAWQRGENVRTVITEGSLTYKFVMIETSKVTVETFYQSTATSAATEGSITVYPTAQAGRFAWVFDVADDPQSIRVVIPEGEVTEVGEVKYANGEAIGREITITAYPSTAIAGGSAKMYMTALKT